MSSAILLGSDKVTEAEIRNIPDVPFTRTHAPIHHRDIIEVIKRGVAAVGLEIVRAEYVLAAEGQRMFAVYDLNQGSSDLCWSIGVRNSMDKSLALGITCGTKVFVCSNLCFSGEFIAFRRHTSGLTMDELGFLAYRSLQFVVPKLRSFQHWHEALHRYALPETDLRVLLVEIMAQNVIPASKFSQFNDLYSRVYDSSLWGFHETVTDILKGSNLMALPKKNLMLNQIIDSYIDSLDSACCSPLGDFYERRARSW